MKILVSLLFIISCGTEYNNRSPSGQNCFDGLQDVNNDSVVDEYKNL